MLKLLKLTVKVGIKADSDDEDDIRERLYEHLQVSMEENELNYEIEEDEEDSEIEE
jgi:hypothetical protein